MRSALALIAVASVLACKRNEPPPPVPAGPPGKTGTARIAGAVRFRGTPPPAPRISRGSFPGCSSDAGPAAPAVQLSPDGVADAFVWARDGVPPGNYPAPAGPVVIDQRGCEYVPRVAGVRAGQAVVFENADAVLHNVHALGAGSNAFNFGMPLAGMRTRRVLVEPQVMVTIACDVHPWMRAYLGVVRHPFFAVTGADGRYELRGLPPGRYTIEAWHERLGRRSEEATVAESGAAVLDFALSP